MGAWGRGPFENDHAADLLTRLLDGEPAPSTLRRPLKAVLRNGYLDIDDVAEARAACALIGYVVMGAPDIDRASTLYEAAAHIRPTPSLIRDCLAAIPALLGSQSELSGLLSKVDRAAVETELDAIRSALQDALTSKPRKLKKPKFGTLPVFAMPVGKPAKWMAFAMKSYATAVFDAAWDSPPSAEALSDLDVLFRCEIIGQPSKWDAIVDLGRIPLRGKLAQPWAAASFVKTACTGSPTAASFGIYMKERGDRKVTSIGYTEAATLPWFRHLDRDELEAALTQHLQEGRIDALRLPSPEELHREHLERCLKERYWRDALDTGAGGGPFDFPAIQHPGFETYVRRWLRSCVTSGEADEVSAPSDLRRWLLIGLLAAVVAPDAVSSIPDDLRASVDALSGHVGAEDVRGALAVLTELVQPERAVMLGLSPERQADFLSQTERVRLSLETYLAN